MDTNKKWYAVYTRPRWEKKVADLLVRKHIDNYCPLNKVVRQWADRKKLVLEPLFTSYVFVHTTPQEHLAIKQTDGILNFVFWLGQPAVIRDEEIDTIKLFLPLNNSSMNTRTYSWKRYMLTCTTACEYPAVR
jgi:transcription antitermination factor NusG